MENDQKTGGTAVGLSAGERLLLWVGSPLAGLALGFLLPRLPDFLLKIKMLPFRGPLKALGELGESRFAVAALVLGALAGLVFAWFAIASSLIVTVTDEDIRLDKDESSRAVARADVAAAFVDGKQLVVLDSESRQLVREEHEGRAGDLAGAFRRHGYPWLDADPYAELYRRWVPDTPDVPPAVNAILAAREEALKKKVRKDIAELRDEAQKLGIVVREEGTRQYWRPLVRS